MNNVVIIAMLIMIALFNIDSFLPQKRIAESRSLLPQDAYILKIEHGENQLVRNGQQWRQRSVERTPSVSPETQVREWQQATLHIASSLNEDVSKTEPHVVVVWLAGETGGHVYAFYPQSTPTVVKVDNRWYTLQDATLDTLLPWIQ